MTRKVIVPVPLARLVPAASRAIRQAQAGDPLASVFVLAGSNALGTALGRELALAGHALAAVRFLTFQDLVIRLVAGRLPGRPVTGLEATLLAGEVLQQRWATGSDSSRLALASAAKETFDRLRNGGVSPDQQHQPVLPGRAGEILDLFRAYQQRLGDRPDSGARFRAAIAQAPVQDTPLIVAGIYSANALQRDLVAAWGGPVTWLMPFTDREHPGVGRLMDDLASRDFAVGEPEPPGGVTSLLTAVQQVWPQQPAHPITPDGTVRLLSATDDAAETREAIRLALDWAHRTGTPLRDIAIVARTADRLSTVMELLLGLDVPFTGNRPLRTTNTGIAIDHALRLLDGETTRTAVFDFLARCSEPELRRRAGGPVDVAYWADLAGRAGIARGTPDQWAAHLKAHRSELVHDSGEEDASPWRQFDAEQASRLMAVTDALFQDLEPGPAVDSPAGWTSRLHRLLNWLPEEDAGTGGQSAPQAVRELLGTVERLGTPLVPRPLFTAIVRDVLGQAGIASGQFQSGGLWLGTASDLRGLRFSLVVVLGMAERVFPLVAGGNALLPDDVAETINEALGTRIETDAERRHLEELLFLQVAAAARDCLVLAWPRSDDADERPRLPSWYVQRVAEMTSAVPVRLEDLDHHPLTIRTDLVHHAAAVDLDADDYDLAAVQQAVLDHQVPGYLWSTLERFPESWEAHQQRKPWAPFSAWDGVLQRPAALSPLLERLTSRGLSPTAVERFRTCPLQFFLASVLGLRPPEEPDDADEISPLDRGSVIHAILERVVNRWIEAGPHDDLGEIASQVFSEAERRGITGIAGLWERNRTVILEDLARYLERRFDGWTPLATEIAFGPDGPWPAVHLGNEHPVPVRGRVDRVDVRPDGTVRVVDYKTGKAGLPKDILEGRRVQLPVYLAAAMATGQFQDGVAEFHFLTRRGGYTDQSISSDQAASALARVHQAVDTMMAALGRGQFPPRPGTACRWCDYRTICGTGIERRVKPKGKRDPQVSALLEALGPA